MTTALDLLTDITVELTAIQGKPPSELIEKGDFPIPSMLPAGDDRGLYTTKEIERKITLLANLLLSEEASRASRYTAGEWLASVRQAIGPRLAEIDLDDDARGNAKLVLAGIRATLAKESGAGEEREHALACTLFGNPDVPPFVIGPLRFEARRAWLHRKRDDGSIPAHIAQRIEQFWSGDTPSPLPSNLEKLQEESILRAARSSYVCTVKTSGFSIDAGKEKALTAARLGLTMIALMWQTPSKILDGLNLLHDREVRQQSVLSFTPGKTTLPGSKLSHMPHGPTLQPGEWESELASRSDYLRVCAEIVEFILSPTGDVRRPRLINALTQSLLWFHEACRETVGLMSVVNYAASLDALASGGKSNGIRRVINARLGIQDSAVLFADGPTLKQAIDEIYSDGRSRAIHGTTDKMGHDWSRTRGVAEQLARLSLVACVYWAASNPSSDDPTLLKQ